MAKQRARNSAPVTAKGRTGILPDTGPARLLNADQGWAYWLKMTFLILVLLAVIYPEAMFQGRVFQSSDAGNSLMFSQVGDRALADGEYPLWNPYLFAGMPSFGSLAYVRYLYPPSILFNFLQNKLGFPPLTWMLGHLLFGGLGMVWLLRRWKLGQAEILLGVAIWLLFPKVVAWGVHGHGSQQGAAMYLPWLIGWTLRLLDGRGMRAVAMTGLLVGLLLLRGHPQIAYYSLGTMIWLAVWAVVWPLAHSWRELARSVRLRRAGKVLAGMALGFLLAGILLVPVQRYAKISIRGQDTAGGGGVGLAYATGWSLAPQEMPTLVLPSDAGFGQATYMGRMPFTDYPNYFGFLVLLLAGMAWGPGRRRWLVAWGVLAVLAIFVSWGNFGWGFYELLYNYLPFFNKFRVPSMILILVAFILAVTAPRGLAAWRAGTVGGPRWLPAAVCAVLGLVLLLAGGLSLAHQGYLGHLRQLAGLGQKPTAPVLLEAAWNLQRGDLIRIGIYLLLAGGAFQLARMQEGFSRYGLPWVLCLLVVADLGRVDARITHPENYLLRVGRGQGGQAALLPAVPLVTEPHVQADTSGPHAEFIRKELGHDRLFPLGQDGSRNTWMADGIRSLGGYHPAKLAAYETIRKRLYGQMPSGRIATWLGAALVSFDQPFGDQDLAALSQRGLDLEPRPLTRTPPYVYRVRSYLPRARLVARWQPVADLPGGGDLDRFLDAVQDGKVDPGRVVHLAGDLPGEPVAAAGIETSTLPAPEFVTDGLNQVVLRTSAPVPAILVLADMNAPGWQVRVDGRPRPLLTADLVLRAVALEAGEHEVEFRYRDPAVKAGLILTGSGAILILALLLAGSIRQRPTRPSGGPQA